MKYILVVDIETKGQNMIDHDMLCFGACIGNTETCEIVDEFQVFIKHSGSADSNWEGKCLDEFWNRDDKMKKVKEYILAEIEHSGRSANDAMNMFSRWVNDRRQDYLDNMIIYTDTAGYDIGFLNLYLSRAKMNTMHCLIGGLYRPIRDATSFHMGVALCNPKNGLWGAEEKAYKHLGREFPKNPYIATHIPVDDAKSICFDIMQIHKAIEEAKKK